MIHYPYYYTDENEAEEYSAQDSESSQEWSQKQSGSLHRYQKFQTSNKRRARRVEDNAVIYMFYAFLYIMYF